MPCMESAKSAQNCSIHDVIISGAGPVGLFLACELALAKCSVLILEKAKNSALAAEAISFRDTGTLGTYD
jgi:2-polyprenyl-6-methoxyphenol hydroxylase-like FAD-dependent oxidoreductase